MGALNQMTVPLVGAGGVAPYTFVVVSGANTTIAATISGANLTVDASSVQPGNYTVEAQATDQAGNVSTTIVPVQVLDQNVFAILNRDVVYEPSVLPFTATLALQAVGGSGTLHWFELDEVTTLPNATISGSSLTFTISSFGEWTVGLRAIDALNNNATALIRVKAAAASAVSVVDGHALLDVSPAIGEVGTHQFTITVLDSSARAVRGTFNYVVEEPVSAVDAVETVVDHVWESNDTTSIVFPITGDLAGFALGYITLVTASNGVTATIDPVNGAIVFNGPPTSYGNAKIDVPIAIVQGSTQVATITREFTLISQNGASLPGTLTCNTRPYIVGELIGLNPMRPDFNSPSFFKNRNYTVRLAADNTLPLGLSLDSVTGLIYGTVLANDVAQSVLQYVDQTGTVQGTITINWTILPSAFTLADNLPDGQLQAQYSGTIAAATGISLSSASVRQGILPTGLALGISADHTSVTLTGTPEVAGYFDIWIEAVSSNGQTAYIHKRLAVDYIVPLTVVTDHFQTLVTGVAFTQTLKAVGGTQPYTWAITSGALPTGLSLDPNSGILSGTTTASSFNQTLTIQVTDQRGVTASRALTLVINNTLTITTAALPQVMPSQFYQFQLQAQGGQGTYTWRLGSGSPALPTGISLSTSGVISGATTLQNYSSNVIVQVNDAANNTVTASLQMLIGTTSGLLIDMEGIGPIVRGSSYQGRLAVTGAGTAPYVWSVTPDSPNPLPAGLSLSADQSDLGTTATLAGKTTADLLNYTVKIQVVDANGNHAFAFLLLDTDSSLAITTLALPQGTVSGNYSAQLQCSGYNTPFTWSLDPSSPPLSPGMTFSSAGLLSGPPTTPASLTLVFRVTDSLGDYATAALPFKALVSTLAVTSASLPSATAGVAYSAQLAATGGAAPFSWSISPASANLLPSGLRIDPSTGVISGTTTVTSFSKPVTFRVTDNLGVYREVTLTVTVATQLKLLTGPDYVQNTTLGFLGMVCQGDVTGISPRPNLSFCVIAKNCISTSASGLSFSLPPGFTATVKSLTNGVATIQLAGPFASGAQGNNSFSFTISDSGVIVSAQFQWYIYSDTGLSLMPATGGALGTVSLYEGTAGQLYVTNQPASPQAFALPDLPSGQAVNYSAAVKALFSLSGSVGGWQSALSLSSTGVGFELGYNGSAVPANTASTRIVLTQDDIAWFNNVANTFDTYTPAGTSGGQTVALQVNWLVQPVISSITPATLKGDGGTYAVTVSLAKPLTPAQATISAAFTASGGLSIVSSQMNKNSAGFVTGWTVMVKTPIVGTTAQVALSLTASDTLTYLSGTALVTNQVNYISGQIGTLTVSGVPAQTLSPSVLYNGWSNYWGDYELTSQGHSWTMGSASGYDNPTSACDGDTTSCASAVHTYDASGDKNYGCVWQFTQLAGKTVTNAAINILSSCPEAKPGHANNGRSGGIYYSLDSGNTWTTLYTAQNRAQQWDSIPLPNGHQFPANTTVYIMAFMKNHDDEGHNVYEIQFNGIAV